MYKLKKWKSREHLIKGWEDEWGWNQGTRVWRITVWMIFIYSERVLNWKVCHKTIGFKTKLSVCAVPAKGFFFSKGTHPVISNLNLILFTVPGSYHILRADSRLGSPHRWVIMGMVVVLWLYTLCPNMTNRFHSNINNFHSNRCVYFAATSLRQTDSNRAVGHTHPGFWSLCLRRWLKGHKTPLWLHLRGMLWHGLFGISERDFGLAPGKLDWYHAWRGLTMNTNILFGFGPCWWDVVGKTEEPRVLAPPGAEQIYINNVHTLKRQVVF